VKREDLQDKDFLYDFDGDVYVVWDGTAICLTTTDSNIALNCWEDDFQKDFDSNGCDIVRVERNGAIIWQLEQKKELTVTEAVEKLLEEGEFNCEVAIAPEGGFDVPLWKKAKCVGFVSGHLLCRTIEDTKFSSEVRTNTVRITKKF
jgi:hypothetical protein